MEDIQSRDEFIDFSKNILFYWTLIVLCNFVLLLTSITSIKVLIIWLPKYFAILIVMSIKFFNRKIYLLLFWCFVMLLLPISISFTMLSPHIYGFYNINFVLQRVILLS